MHSSISNNSQKFKIEFIKAYNGKCAYCGASIDLIKKSEFEIDHFLYEKAPVFATKKDAGYIDNLILACHDCNHNKNAFWVDEEGFDELFAASSIAPSIRSERKSFDFSITLVVSCFRVQR